ncbi:small-conductance mechanosensitive channel [Paenibacillus thiaminolyticus]|uniref:Small-conductance mechanosensitive channel n=1 Tax=Paenibacillus thiaminolyticus TaxID=49283 RepID=A0A3A3GQX4_PANTH|nr:small-conductance mechanosensitive channel [Paenibacillus thiaminolyticus]RJG25918.1 small-conductance mechanosensitive channel [Paenibacillus thiaminolyticus]
MKKTILSLTAVLAIFASVPVYASPVVDSASEVSVNEVVSVKPTINIMYQSKEPGNDVYIYDGSYPMPEIIISKLSPGESKVVEYVKLRKGQKLWIDATCGKTLADGSTIIGYSNDKIEITADKDGYYLVEVSAPNSDVKEYRIVAEFGIG